MRSVVYFHISQRRITHKIITPLNVQVFLYNFIIINIFLILNLIQLQNYSLLLLKQLNLESSLHHSQH